MRFSAKLKLKRSTGTLTEFRTQQVCHTASCESIAQCLSMGATCSCRVGHVRMHAVQEAAQSFLDSSSSETIISSGGMACAHSCVDLGDAVSLDPVTVGGDSVREPLLLLSDAAAPPRGVAPKDTAAVTAAAEREAPKDEVVVGMLYYAASSVFFASMAVCSKMLQNDGYPVWELLFIRAIILFLFSLPALLATGAPSQRISLGHAGLQ